MIELKNVSFQYKNGNRILENINLEIHEGEMISVIGKNGAGKSTLINLLAGITKPNEGDILMDGLNTKSKKNFMELRKKVGIVFQNPESQILFPNVYDDLEFALKNLNLENRKDRIENALDIVNMKEFVQKDSYELSLGQKQRINIASVLAVKPKYIILDEPTTMIDSNEKENVYEVLRSLKEEGYTIIFVTNQVNEILLSDKIFIMKDKQIKYAFAKEALIENVGLLKECDIKIPEMLELVLKLKENDISVNLKEWTIPEMISEIVRVCKNEKYH